MTRIILKIMRDVRYADKNKIIDVLEEGRQEEITKVVKNAIIKGMEIEDIVGGTKGQEYCPFSNKSSCASHTRY